MLKLNESFKSAPILSLRVGGPIARTISPIINPNNLYIEGWHVIDNRSGEKLILLSKDIRDIIDQGIVVNDHEVLSHVSDLIRLKDVLKLRFNPIGLKVTSESKKNYGKVTDFAFETINFYVQKIYTAQPLIKNLSGGSLSIDRSQILEITTKRIIIEDPTEKSRSRIAATAPIN
jgi:hypothetical protein